MSESLFPLGLGVPANSSAAVRWAQDGSQVSVLAELQAGPEHLKAELNGGRTGGVFPRWEYVSRLQHQVKALLKRGILGSIQGKTHYQVQDTSPVKHIRACLFGLFCILICFSAAGHRRTGHRLGPSHGGQQSG